MSILGAVAMGADPTARLAAEKSAMIIKDAAELYLVEHVRPKKKERSADYYDWLLRKYVMPAIGNLPTQKVTRADLFGLHNKMKDCPYQANRTLSVISSLYTFLSKRGNVTEGYNPAGVIAIGMRAVRLPSLSRQSRGDTCAGPSSSKLMTLRPKVTFGTS
jgi:hypothetical protein